MSAPTIPIPTTGPSRARRTLALAGAETRLFLRNRTAVVNSVVLPLLLVAAVPTLGIGSGAGDADDIGGRLVVTAVGVTLVYLTYYNLLTTFVARREELVLQRMRTGELTGPEVVLGTAAPTLLISVGQVAVVAVGMTVLGQAPSPVDAVLPLVALAGGAALMLLLAAASTAFTRSAESAQITALPLLVASSALSGLLFPLAVLPGPLATAARLLPVSPVVELARLGLLGRTWDGREVDLAGVWAAAPLPLALLAGWLIVGGWAARRWFRWAPRR
ncbi:ABC transporter permease [Modestobacter lapidis]|nr:ABC transporter permease [Modestobacter lapidis]